MIGIIIALLKVVVVLVCVLLIFSVLLQRPKNEGLGAAFGGDTASNIFGAQTTNVLATVTRWLGGIFIVVCLLIAWLGTVNPDTNAKIDEYVKKEAAAEVARDKADADKKAAEENAAKAKAEADAKVKAAAAAALAIPGAVTDPAKPTPVKPAGDKPALPPKTETPEAPKPPAPPTPPTEKIEKPTADPKAAPTPAAPPAATPPAPGAPPATPPAAEPAKDPAKPAPPAPEPPKAQ